MANAEFDADFYRDLVDMSQDLVWQCDSVGHYTYLNPAWEKVFGYRLDEMLGKMFSDFQTPDVAARDKAEFARLIKDGSVKGYDTIHIGKAGNEIHLTFFALTKYDAQGNIIGSRGTAHDNTSRIHAEIELREAEKKFRALFEKGPIAVAFHRMEYDASGKPINYVFIDANENYLKLTGVDPRGKRVTEAFPGIEKDPFDWIGTFGRVAMTGEQIRFQQYLAVNNRWYDCVGYQYKPDHFVASFIEITESKRAVEAQAQSELKYRTLFDSNRDAIMIQDETRFLDCNLATLEMFGCATREEFCAFHPAHLSAPIQGNGVGAFELANQLIEMAMRTGRAHFEWVSKRADNGLEFASEVLLSAIKLDGKSVLMASVRDISSRKNIEKKLHEERIFSEKIINSLPGIFYLYSYPELRLVRWNKNHETTLGYQPGEIDNRSLFDWHVPEVKPLVKEAVDIAMERGMNEMESPLLHKDGHYVPFLMTGVRLETNGQEYLMGIGIDITERKRTEELLRESEEKMRALFKAMTEMVALHELVFDDAGKPINYRITNCNQAFTNITGITAEQAIGKLATEVYHVESAPYLEEFTRVAITGESYEYTTYYKPMDKHFAISVVCPRKNTFATITTDITGIHRVQEVITEKNKELENYLYVASHDLRAPLVNLQGFSQRLDTMMQELDSSLRQLNCPDVMKSKMNEMLNDGIPKSLKFIRSSVAKMDALINGLLRISRTGRVEMNVQEIDMNRLWGNIIASHNFLLEEVYGHIDLQDLPNCYGDEDLLNQLFSNILTNAIKYRDRNRTLQIVVTGKAEYNKVQYCIQDNGVGINPRHMQRIWDVFFRVNSTSENPGDGLGLSIVKRIAEKHNGRVWAESELGQGCRFYVELQQRAFKVEQGLGG